MSQTKGQRQIEFLRQVLTAGGAITKVSFSIDRRTGPASAAYVLTLDQHGALTLQDLPWTPEIEEFLLHERPTKMASLDEERERFANLLGNNLKALESQVRPDFVDAVLVELLREHPEYQLADVIAKAPVYPPSKGSASYAGCRQLLEHALRGLHNTAVLKLRYPDGPETVRLIGEALELVLDDRFHISLRAQLFT